MKRVKQFSFDIAVDESVDGYSLLEEMMEYLGKKYFLLGVDFAEDLTEEYCKEPYWKDYLQNH